MPNVLLTAVNVQIPQLVLHVFHHLLLLQVQHLVLKAFAQVHSILIHQIIVKHVQQIVLSVQMQRPAINVQDHFILHQVH